MACDFLRPIYKKPKWHYGTLAMISQTTCFREIQVPCKSVYLETTLPRCFVTCRGGLVYPSFLSHPRSWSDARHVNEEGSRCLQVSALTCLNWWTCQEGDDQGNHQVPEPQEMLIHCFNSIRLGMICYTAINSQNTTSYFIDWEECAFED